MRLGKYELHEVLGKGGFGTVYRATDLTLEREVAVKVLHPQLTVDSDFIARFQREARLMANLEHPNIVPVYELGEIDGRFVIVMRLVKGGSLADLIKQGALPYSRVMEVMKDICAGLQAAHTKGWVHRDLKPGNILLDEDGRALLSDFGLARSVQVSSSASSSLGGVGTPFYRAPELWLGIPAASPATDVYALGCILYEMLTGKDLFSGDTPDQVITRHLVIGPEFGPGWPPAGTPSGVAEVVVKALDRDPARRYPDAGAFLAALQGIETEQARKTAEEKASAERSAIEANASRITTGRQVAGPDQRPVAEEKAQRVIEAAPETPPKRLSTLALVAIVLVGLIGLTWLLGKLFTYTPPATIAPTQPIPTTISPTKAWTVTIAPPTQTVTMTFTPTNTLTPTLGIGSAKISTIDGMELLYVPAGKFLMGSDKSVDPQAYDNELPQHTVYLDAFWIDQTLVTNAMFTLFIQAIGYRTDAEKAGWGYVYQNGTWSQVNGANWQDPQGSGAGIQKIENHPVVQVSWNDANAYCQWAGRRLPTEAEWEKAARGTDGRIYPWGSQAPDATLANFNSNDTTQVGSYPAGKSPYGALDMAGNVWEWVEDWSSDTYYQLSPSNNPGGPPTGEYRVLRGGAWNFIVRNVRSADRGRGLPDLRLYGIGFRCAVSP